MSYAEFHLLFLLPPILLMWASLPRTLEEIGGQRAQWALPLIAVVAFAYTTPWDNYLVAREVWWYGPERVLFTIGYVPIEEYVFFLLQPILTGLFLLQYLARSTRSAKPATPLSAWGGFALFLAGALIGALLLFLQWPSGVYMGLVLSWSCPLLAGMWLYDGRTLWAHRKGLFYTVSIPTVYLWIADAIAIRTGIWTISKDYTLGFTPLGLPIEEATFFLMTNLLVIKGVLLLLYGSHYALEENTEGSFPSYP